MEWVVLKIKPSQFEDSKIKMLEQGYVLVTFSTNPGKKHLYIALYRKQKGKE